jgi:hypothetical protein
MVGKAILFTEHRLPNITMFEDVHETPVNKTVLLILLLGTCTKTREIK